MGDHFQSLRTGTREALVLGKDPEVVRVLREAVGERAEVRSCPSWTLLIEELRSNSWRGVVVDPFQEDRTRIAPGLVRLMSELPSTRVLCVIDARRTPTGVVLELGRMGIAEIIDRGTELTPPAVRERLRQVPPDAFRTLLDVSGLDQLNGRARLLVERAAQLAAEGGLPRDLAAALGMGSSTLRRWAQRAGLPNPRELFRWLRILLAASLLDDPGRTVQGAALAAGYADASGLRRAMIAVTNRSPTELRDVGAFQEVLGQLTSALQTDG